MPELRDEHPRKDGVCIVFSAGENSLERRRKMAEIRKNLYYIVIPQYSDLN